jgi:general secretion pathway protein E
MHASDPNTDISLKPDPWLLCQTQFALATPGRHTAHFKAETGLVATSVPSLVEQILTSASQAGASDVHFELGDRMVVRARRDGALRTIFVAPAHTGRIMMGRLKALGKMPLCAEGSGEGSFSLRCDEAVVHARLSLVGMVSGEKAVVRLLDRGNALQLPELGMLERDLVRYDHLLRSPGLVLISGPAGSGKTTTLYASLLRLAHPSACVVSLEDPVEMVFPGVVQVDVRHRSSGFQERLTAVLRQDPDVIAIGEIRDHDSAMAAVRAALTGRTALASIHAGDAVSAAYRLTDLGIPHSLAGPAVSGAVSQRLVRAVCRACKGTGCAACGRTGVHGRTGVFEVLSFPFRLSVALATGAGLEAARGIRAAIDQPSLQEAAEQAVTAGLTIEGEVSRLFEGGYHR